MRLGVWAATLSALIVVVFSQAAWAQQSCVCSQPSGCVIVSAPFPPTSPQPTRCAAYKNKVQIGSAAVWDSQQVPTANAGVCAPPSGTYDPGPIGSKTCAVRIPQQPLGPVTITMRALYGTVLSPHSDPYTFTNAATIATPATATQPAPERVTK